MINEAFVAFLSLLLGALLCWGFVRLPREGYQFLAVLPSRKLPDGSWISTNLTGYGFFNALALSMSVALLIILLGSLRVSERSIPGFVLPLLALCIAASKGLARIVENKKNTFTVGGAAFVGILAAPWWISLLNGLSAPSDRLPLLPAMAALSICYAMGEGVGRLACISFGCCYGRPLSDCPLLIRRLFARRCFVFRGATRKIAYAGRLEGVPVMPVQALTSALYALVAIAGVALFLSAEFGAAFFLCIATTQLWRWGSEFFRADDRGRGRLTVYQWMALSAVVYGAVILFRAGADPAVPDLFAGFALLWRPETILLLFGTGAGMFLYMGRSRVTYSRVRFHIHEEQI